MAKPIKITILGDASSFQASMTGVQTSMAAMSKAAKLAAAAGVVAVAALGVAAIKVGADFEDARNDIAIATGATGAALDSQFKEFKDVLRSVPNSMQDVAAATGAVSTQLHLEGDALERVTRLGVNFADTLGADIGPTTDSAARVMNQFGVSADDADGFFGDLLKTTQNYGIDAGKLLGDLENMGPALQAVGFSAEGAAAFLGEANQAGLNVTRLKSPLLQFADAAITAGEDPAAAFADFFEQAKGLTDQTDLLALANDRFGTTGGAAVAEMVEAGIDLDQLNDLLGDNAGLVDATAKATRTWQEKLSILKNRVLVKIEPVLAKITAGLDRFVDILSTKAGPAITTTVRFFQNFGENFEKHKPIIVGVGVAISAIVVPAILLLTFVLGTMIVSFLTAAAPIVALVVGLGAIAAGLVWAYENVEIFHDVVDVAFAAVKVIVKNAVDVVVTQIKAVIEIGQGVIDFFRGVFTGDFGLAWDGVKQIVEGAVRLVTAPIRGLIKTIKGIWDLGFLKTAAKAAVDAVVFYFTKLPGKIIGLYADVLKAGFGLGKSILDGIGNGISGAAGFVGDIASQVGAAIKNFINANVIDRFNRAVEFKISLPFGRKFSINPPDIPHLSTGGPFSGLAVVGEHGPEVMSGRGTVLSNTESRSRGINAGPLVGTMIVNNGTPGEVLQMLRMARRTSAL